MATVPLFVAPSLLLLGFSGVGNVDAFHHVLNVVVWFSRIVFVTMSWFSISPSHNHIALSQPLTSSSQPSQGTTTEPKTVSFLPPNSPFWRGVAKYALWTKNDNINEPMRSGFGILGVFDWFPQTNGHGVGFYDKYWRLIGCWRSQSEARRRLIGC